MLHQKWNNVKSSKLSVRYLSGRDGMNGIIPRLLVNRGYLGLLDTKEYLTPEAFSPVDPYDDFIDLGSAVDIIIDCIVNSKKITICGDYDADGMTSTALLIRALRHCGAIVDYVIPSRMTDGYGINARIVYECSEEKTDTIITVDNGISAAVTCKQAIELGLRVIITDHHDLPEELPQVHAILNPKMIRDDSPYKTLAGVGVAYILAISVAQKLGAVAGLVKPLSELYTIGTIADMASLTGINRKWVKRGLKYLVKPDVLGIQAILCSMNERHKQRTGYSIGGMTADTIGFKIAPRINAIGRIGNPQMVIDLLTADSSAVAYKLAEELETTNETRQKLCGQIELEAIAIVEDGQKQYVKKNRVLCVFGSSWHHGVIGIVASRLVERYGVPVFIATYHDDGKSIRGSARGIPGFDVFKCLQWSSDVIGKHGGHPMAGGFSLPSENWKYFVESCVGFAQRTLKPSQIGTQVHIDAVIDLTSIDDTFVEQVSTLQPFGVGNSEPVFRANGVYIDKQKVVGVQGLKLEISNSAVNPCCSRDAISWNLGEYAPLPGLCDIVFKVRHKWFRDARSIELEVIGYKEHGNAYLSTTT